MKKYEGLGRLALAVGTVIAAITVAGLAHAALSLYTSDNVRYIAHWTWNDYDTNSANVEVLLQAQPPRRPKEKAPAPSKSCIQNFKVRVAARADDGTTVENSDVVQVPLGATRKVTIPFDRTLTSLEFIKILALPGGSCFF